MKIIIITKRSMWSVVLVLFVFISCSKKETKNDLELSLLNKEIVCYSKNSSKDSINIIYYSLKNNSNNIYFINNLTDERELSKRAVYKNGINLHIYDQDNVEAKYEIMRYYNEGLETEVCGVMGINYLIYEEAKGLGDMIDESSFGKAITIKMYEGLY